MIFSVSRRSYQAHLTAAAAVFGFILTCSGCGQSQSGGSSTASTPTDEHAHDHEGHDHDHDAGEVEAALSKLSPEDRKLAEAQKVCVVAKEPLGIMGTPVKVEHNGQVAFLCCEGCRAAFEKEPETFLAALNEAGESGAEAAAVPAEEGSEAKTDDAAGGTPAEGT